MSRPVPMGGVELMLGNTLMSLGFLGVAVTIAMRPEVMTPPRAVSVRSCSWTRSRSPYLSKDTVVPDDDNESVGSSVRRNLEASFEASLAPERYE